MLYNVLIRAIIPREIGTKNEMKTMEDLDWAEMWNKLMEESYWGQRAGTPEFWDERVDWFKELVQQSNRAEMIISRIKIEPDYRVLDIGAGPGTVTIPLAKTIGCDSSRTIQWHACTLKGECIEGKTGKRNIHKQEMGGCRNRK